MQNGWLDFCIVWDRITSNSYYLIIQTALCVLYKSETEFHTDVLDRRGGVAVLYY